MSPATKEMGVGMILKTRDFRWLEDQVGEIIFLATGGSESGGSKQ